MSKWTTLKFHVSPDDVREDQARRPLAVGEPVGFDEEFFVVVGVREDGSYDVKPHPREDAILEAMLDPVLPIEEAMKKAWAIGKMAPDEVAALVGSKPRGAKEE